jgi:hypothetical protein
MQGSFISSRVYISLARSLSLALSLSLSLSRSLSRSLSVCVCVSLMSVCVRACVRSIQERGGCVGLMPDSFASYIAGFRVQGSGFRV